MATYIDQYSAARSSGSATFHQRVAIALVKAAVAISSEATSTTNHANRVVLSKAVVLSPDSYAVLFALGIIAQLNVGPDASVVTDVQLDTQVSALWNTYSGVP